MLLSEASSLLSLFIHRDVCWSFTGKQGQCFNKFMKTLHYNIGSCND